ncbi:MAG TPA: sulfite exporter TauE/SafE family protein [Candidatus Tenderia electrophaga]|uniref:Sulfite exporter TauE/SafE family protein n=1 Tax=Candidatus Tenderia electrophaga TaxID=1748243 RepID=A0A832N3B0_9GAMM|nr:sulfite exporter TauE/SafE family protein [Candidatus Tenderia electrophaga]
MTELIAASFAIGFLGSLHCVGMCGGLVSAMTMTRDKTWWPGVISYQLGRITTYTSLGLIAGLIGSLFANDGWLSQAQNLLSIIAGTLIIILALHIAGWLPDPFSRLSQRIAKATGMAGFIKTAATQNATGPWYSVGLLNGLLPCGLVYAGIGLSLTAQTSWQGALAMFSFGLGTVPAMLAVPALMRAISPAMRGRVLKVGAVLLILIGAFTIFRGTAMGQHEHGSHGEAEHQHEMPMEHQHEMPMKHLSTGSE